VIDGLGLGMLCLRGHPLRPCREGVTPQCVIDGDICCVGDGDCCCVVVM
jgi:hypothetical protein